MKSVRPAKENVFKLVFAADEQQRVRVKAYGRIAADSQSIHLCYGKNRQQIGQSHPPHFIIQTLGRPLVPLYAREVGGEVWISNDIASLLIENEVVSIRLVEMLFAATGSDGPKSLMSHLLDDIVFLMPSSVYQIGADDTGRLSCTWTDLVFSPQPSPGSSF